MDKNRHVKVVAFKENIYDTNFERSPPHGQDWCHLKIHQPCFNNLSSMEYNKKGTD
jgi:hypothetical protein